MAYAGRQDGTLFAFSAGRLARALLFGLISYQRAERVPNVPYYVSKERAIPPPRIRHAIPPCKANPTPTPRVLARAMLPL